MQVIICGPEIQRFNSLKVGDTVTFRYYESVATAIRQPGSAPAAAASTGVTRTPGAKPGGAREPQSERTRRRTIAARLLVLGQDLGHLGHDLVNVLVF
jgi:hypothetical protein